MSQILFKNVIKLMTSSLVPCNYVILCFWGERPIFDQLFFFFRGIKLPFGGWINSETLISYLCSQFCNFLSCHIYAHNFAFLPWIRFERCREKTALHLSRFIICLNHNTL